MFTYKKWVKNEVFGTAEIESIRWNKLIYFNPKNVLRLIIEINYFIIEN